MKQVHKDLQKQAVLVMDGKTGAAMKRMRSLRERARSNCSCCMRYGTANESTSSSSNNDDLAMQPPSAFAIICATLPRFVPLILPFFIGAWIIGSDEHWKFVETLYYIIATVTTIGYGDFTPQSDAAKLFVIIAMPFAVFAFSQLLGKCAEASASATVIRKEAEIFENGLGESFLDLMDRHSTGNGDGKVTKLEYLQFMLLMMHKVDRDFLEKIDAQFERLDGSGNGELDSGDICIGCNGLSGHRQQWMSFWSWGGCSGCLRRRRRSRLNDDDDEGDDGSPYDEEGDFEIEEEKEDSNIEALGYRSLL
eukprot:CAMPEP_0116019758 /NCGR_PEP_ID=MMETSP0321-20121206/9417_1 /TAXON_ID=163516 /ORGANISM="Leptocylindrus danicus var. danicus, Strain B650" /LENGTH=307 /DNA_ID=CAMNT_0003490369 /DNA_START=401 /DNA_END=1325 /DNA_ORIENTATION=-